MTRKEWVDHIMTVFPGGVEDKEKAKEHTKNCTICAKRTVTVKHSNKNQIKRKNKV